MKNRILKEIDRRIRRARTQKQLVLKMAPTKAVKLAVESYEEEKLTLQSIRKWIVKNG